MPLDHTHQHNSADIMKEDDPHTPISPNGEVTPAAFVEPTTATPQAIAEALIAAGLMEAE